MEQSINPRKRVNGITRPWTWRDEFVVIFYGAPLHLIALCIISFVKMVGFGFGFANFLSRANNRFIKTFRPGSRRIIQPKSK